MLKLVSTSLVLTFLTVMVARAESNPSNESSSPSTDQVENSVASSSDDVGGETTAEELPPPAKVEPDPATRTEVPEPAARNHDSARPRLGDVPWTNVVPRRIQLQGTRSVRFDSSEGWPSWMNQRNPRLAITMSPPSRNGLSGYTLTPATNMPTTTPRRLQTVSVNRSGGRTTLHATYLDDKGATKTFTEMGTSTEIRSRMVGLPPAVQLELSQHLDR